MADKMTTCKACEKEIAKGIKKCPSCGADQRNFFGKHKIITIILALIIIGGIGSALGGGGGSKTTTADSNKATTSAPASQQPKADPMVVTADKLVEDLKSNALNASNTYKGKYVEVTGKLSNIDSNGKYFSVSPMNDNFSMTNILCNITQEQKDAVSKFTKDQKVTVIGTITDVGEVMGYSLKVESIK